MAPAHTRIGIFLGGTFAHQSGLTNLVDHTVELAHEAAHNGVHTLWFGQGVDYDAIQLAALVGREVPTIQVGTSTVPMYPRHPLLVAAAAKTAQAATDGRFRLGVGLGARNLLEPQFGLPYPPQIQHLREYLVALRRLLDGDGSRFEGETLVSRPVTPVTVAGATARIPILVAAMGAKALAAAGTFADGTATYLAGPRAIAERIRPVITEAAEAAGRPVPRIVAGVPAVVTDDPDAAHARARAVLGFYDAIPSYQKVVSHEGLSRAADLLLAGDEDTVRAGLHRYLDAGSTELMLSHTELLGDEARARTWALIRNL
ncbi:TIGR03564 family F420-dependent LLM class oxidoreductase [Kribbella sp. NPDC056861]|uniref:TIGR03564 family F420-dependent LLM class oxidoreductase n=1 Tax=Kribbella sp. NPDC056861 TaxID=3154857 RepID=UPI0034308348